MRSTKPRLTAMKFRMCTTKTDKKNCPPEKTSPKSVGLALGDLEENFAYPR